MVFNIEDESGKILDKKFEEKYQNSGSKVNLERQLEAHPHSVYKWRDFLYVVDLGADKVWRYQVKEDGNLMKIGETSTPRGWGPRHMAMSQTQ